MSSLLAQLDELSDAGSEASEAEAPPEGFSYVTGLRATAADVLGPLLSREELRSRLEERSAARQRRDFRAADAARDALAQRGYTLDDRAKSWTAPDGTSGSIDPFSVAGEEEEDQEEGSSSGAHAAALEAIQRVADQLTALQARAASLDPVAVREACTTQSCAATSSFMNEELIY
ncbi:hypothetical protein EMIHUDRAFT_358492 [Emiliania huxleyi CCMP1516]|uniref:Uncharacterized protein n=2 Tax=Emiliania huxleyi TaxID=2903 RepID=A0A0D3ID70_EMIH1|nr:hypothetical protein EMIHUDRAFT_358492 [Emiliania huxleyi CCMP1516]EOD09205.1 hypothetical protein EMIHUDRAFT_358492 [Emiliania huxleyi CCMP1516]|eukprot:XP_005761634.1 hypothetical protein EMIHUDRAFT_358492 [Emiliania huxleyi CCMP1516]